MAAASTGAGGGLDGPDAVAAQFIELALAHGVLGFGEYTLKSGRRSPYFFNSARFDSGSTLAGLARAYAGAVAASGIEADLLFGPAYKGIPLVAATAVQLAEHHGVDLPWSFNRKEAKDHGEGGSIVGHAVAGRVLLVDDIITAGTAIREAVEIVTAAGGEVVGIVVAIDRQERGQGELSAVQEVERDLGCPVVAILTLSHILTHLERTGEHAEHLPALRAYRDEFGVDG